MSEQKVITVTNGFIVDSDLLSETQWEELETKLNNREVDTSDLAAQLGISDKELNELQTHTETLIFNS